MEDSGSSTLYQCSRHHPRTDTPTRTQAIATARPCCVSVYFPTNHTASVPNNNNNNNNNNKQFIYNAGMYVCMCILLAVFTMCLCVYLEKENEEEKVHWTRFHVDSERILNWRSNKNHVIN